MDLTTIIGILGTAILVFTFILNENHKLNVDDLTFDILHLFGSLFLIIYAVEKEIHIFVILNGVAAFISLNDIVKGLLGKPKSKVKVGLIRQKRHKKKHYFWQNWFKQSKKTSPNKGDDE